MLSAVGLTNICLNSVVIDILVGINSGMETLASQAYGARDFQLYGIYLNRGILILTAIFIPVSLLISTFSEACLISLGIDHQVSQLVQT